MFFSISGIHPKIPANYQEIIRQLRELGLSPTGNYQIDVSRLQAALKKKTEKFEIKHAEIEQNSEGNNILKELEEERLGAQVLGEQKRFFFGL